MTSTRTVMSGLLVAAALISGCGLAGVPGVAPKGRTSSGLQAAGKARPAAPRVEARAVPADYYAPVAQLQGQLLLRGLKALIGRHKDLGYDGARDAMFADVDDLDNDDTVSCIYIGRALDRVTDRSSAFRNGNGLNAEHTWPQSKGAEGVAKADLHHLFPADVKANSTRGSYPFGEVVYAEWSDGGSTLGRDMNQQRVFQPRTARWGETARALFYFYTVYGQDGGIDLSNFRREEAVLRKWHEGDPPTAEERLRNDMVFAIQGNRNPYVDHPEYVKRVGAFLRPDGPTKSSR